MRRVPWLILLGLLTGVGLGLAYSWVISPVQVTDASPLALRPDFKDHYRSAIAAAYAANGNLPRAQERLALLGDEDSVQALNAQAQRMLATRGSRDPAAVTDQLAALAFALEQGIAFEPSPTAVSQIADTVVVTSTPPAETPGPIAGATGSPQPVETQTTIAAALRPTQTAPPTLGAPFALTSQETVCDPNLPDGLLQIVVFDSRRRQLAGAEILIAWNDGEERFFTGLKPELGNGYADFVMEPNTAYTVQLAAGSDISSGLTTSTCQSPNGETFVGGVKLTFQQP
jgi:hypothetical protein